MAIGRKRVYGYHKLVMARGRLIQWVEMSMRSRRIFTMEIAIGRGADYKLNSSIELEGRPHDTTVTNWEPVTEVLKNASACGTCRAGGFDEMKVPL